MAVYPPLGKARVLAHTCECSATLYELCCLGGGYFIRRTTRHPNPRTGDLVHESPHVPAAHAHDLWVGLLGGSAR